MTQSSKQLSGALRKAAEAFFEMDLGGVTIHRGTRAHECGAAAIAIGNEIHLAADCTLAAAAGLELFGHEMTHVVQQRQGRVRPTAHWRGTPLNDDPALEREAVEMGRRFAFGGRSTLPHLPISMGHPPVLQRAILLGNQPLQGQGDLSPKASTVLGLIDNGPAWLKFAVQAASVRYRFAGEGELIAGVQSGLHGSEVMLLPELAVRLHPFKLMEMEPDDLNAVAAAEQHTDSTGVAQMQAKKILAKHRLLTQGELAVGLDLLAQTGVSGAPVFQSMDLADHIALFNLVDGASTEISLNPMIQKEAAAFAAVHAQTPAEFVDYYQFYVVSVDDPAPQQGGAVTRGRSAEVELESLQGLLYAALFCPAVPCVAPPSPEQLNQILQNWVAAGNSIGFPNLSRAVAQVEENAGIKGSAGESASRAIAQYMDAAAKFILQQPAGSMALSQDGGQHDYTYRGATGAADVVLDANGNITLAAYRPASS